MQFNGGDIGGKDIGSVQWGFEGDVEKAKALMGLGRSVLGGLKNSMKFANLTTNKSQVILDTGEVIQALSIKGSGGTADIDKVLIYVPKNEKEENTSGFKCLGYIVQAFVAPTNPEAYETYQFEVTTPSGKTLKNFGVWADLVDFAGFPDNNAKYMTLLDDDTNEESPIQEVVVISESVHHDFTEIPYTWPRTRKLAPFTDDFYPDNVTLSDQEAIPILYGGVQGAPIGGTTSITWDRTVPGAEDAATLALDNISWDNADAAIAISVASTLAATQERNYDATDYWEARRLNFYEFGGSTIYKEVSNNGFITGTGIKPIGKNEFMFTKNSDEFGQIGIFMIPDKQAKIKYSYSPEFETRADEMANSASGSTDWVSGEIVFAGRYYGPFPYSPLGPTIHDTATISVQLQAPFSIPIEVEEGVHTIKGMQGSGYYKVQLLVQDDKTGGTMFLTVKINDIEDGDSIKVLVGPIDSPASAVWKV